MKKHGFALVVVMSFRWSVAISPSPSSSSSPYGTPRVERHADLLIVRRHHRITRGIIAMGDVRQGRVYNSRCP